MDKINLRMESRNVAEGFTNLPRRVCAPTFGFQINLKMEIYSPPGRVFQCTIQGPQITSSKPFIALPPAWIPVYLGTVLGFSRRLPVQYNAVYKTGGRQQRSDVGLSTRLVTTSSSRETKNSQLRTCSGQSMKTKSAKRMKRTGIEPATLRLQSRFQWNQTLTGVESSTIEPPLQAWVSVE